MLNGVRGFNRLPEQEGFYFQEFAAEITFKQRRKKLCESGVCLSDAKRVQAVAVVKACNSISGPFISNDPHPAAN